MKVKLKRLSCAALALVLALPLAACGGQQAASTPTPGADGGAVVFTRENMPRLDGSTATAPLAQAAAAVLLGESEEDVADLIDFSRTTESYRQLMQGDADLLIAAEPNAAVFDEMEEAGFEVQMEPLATDALVFMVNEDNPVDSLTTEQLRGIYSGEITNWSEVGGADLEIVPFQRNAESGSQVLMEKLVMDGTEMTEPPEGYMIASMGGLMDAVKEYDNSSNAIGCDSSLVTGESLPLTGDNVIGFGFWSECSLLGLADGYRIIAVDGVEPTAQSISSGEYTLGLDVLAGVDSGAAEDSAERTLWLWLQGSVGQAFISSQGYLEAVQ